MACSCCHRRPAANGGLSPFAASHESLLEAGSHPSDSLLTPALLVRITEEAGCLPVIGSLSARVGAVRIVPTLLSRTGGRVTLLRQESCPMIF